MHFLDLSKVRDFTGALRDAVQDRREEEAHAQQPADQGKDHRGNRSLLFLDTDSVLGTILGLTLKFPELDQLGQQGLVPNLPLAVRALLSSGGLGKVRMLRPHLLELDKEIEKLPDPKSQMSRAFLQAQARYLSRLWKLEQYEEHLRSVFDGERDGASFVEKYGYDAFVRVELVMGGTWKHRLHRVHEKSLSFDSIPEDSVDPRLPEFETYYSRLSDHRPGMSENNAIDALALASLSFAVSVGRTVRFYSETRAVVAAAQEIDSDAPTGTHIAKGIPPRHPFLRSSLYLLLRASFPALALEDLQTSISEEDISLSDFEDRAEDLVGLFSEPMEEESLLAAVRQLQLGSQKLDSLISEFYRLRTMAAVRSRMELSQQFQNVLPSFSRALLPSSREEQLISAEIEKSYRETRETLNKQIGVLHGWHSYYRRLQRALSDRRAELKAEAEELRLQELPPPRLDTDLGLARWDLPNLLRDKQAVEDYVASLSRLSKRTLEQEAVTMALSIYSGDGLPDTEKILVGLWFLQDARLFSDAYERLWRNQYQRAESHVAFRALYDVSRTKSTFERGKKKNAAERYTDASKIIKDAEELVEAQDPRHRASALMGVAHVTYWAWQRTQGFETDNDLSAERDRWIERSFEAGLEARNVLEPATTQWAFAVNHCAYVGRVARLDPKETEHCAELLESYARAYRHFRFADTLAVPMVENVKDRIRTVGGIAELVSRPGDLKLIEQVLGSARRLLESARPFYNDEEASTRWREVLKLSLEIAVHRAS
ncbi:MAG: hypothetical protein MPN21_27010 [Thermoanaerobaculia bacterium]|nr:hypothetical protein [Thermoanaerobaculia bacterium]